jgi:hypothetical protein
VTGLGSTSQPPKPSTHVYILSHRRTIGSKAKGASSPCPQCTHACWTPSDRTSVSLLPRSRILLGHPPIRPSDPRSHLPRLFTPHCNQTATHQPWLVKLGQRHPRLFTRHCNQIARKGMRLLHRTPARSRLPPTLPISCVNQMVCLHATLVN